MAQRYLMRRNTFFGTMESIAPLSEYESQAYTDWRAQLEALGDQTPEEYLQQRLSCPEEVGTVQYDPTVGNYVCIPIEGAPVPDATDDWMLGNGETDAQKAARQRQEFLLAIAGALGIFLFAKIYLRRQNE